MKTILVADDKPAGRDLVRTVLESCGYTVVEAVDGKEAVRQAHQSHPDLIILDLHMPDLDGFGVIAELRRETEFASTPIRRTDGKRDAGRPRTSDVSRVHRIPYEAHPVVRLAERGRASITIGVGDVQIGRTLRGVAQTLGPDG